MISSAKEYTEVARPLIVSGQPAGKHLRNVVDHFGSEREQPMSSPAAASDIREEVAGLRRLLGARNFLPLVFDAATREQRSAWVKELTEAGHRVFTKLFTPDDGRRLLASIGEGEPAIVWVRDETVFIPWEFLHPEKVGDECPLTLGGFLGTRALFVRKTTTTGPEAVLADVPIDPSDPFAYVPVVDDPTEADDNRVILGHVFDDQLPSTKVPAEMRWQNRHRDRLRVRNLTTLCSDDDRRQEMNDAVAAFMRDPHDIVHFDCHTKRIEPADDPPELSMRIKHEYWTQMSDIATWGLRANTDVLIVLNLCESDVSIHRQDSMARVLQRNGGRSVLGTSSRLGDAFAAGFAADLYERLLDADPVGTALFETRNAVGRATGNPLALGYTLHGAAGHRVGGSDAPPSAVSEAVGGKPATHDGLGA